MIWILFDLSLIWVVLASGRMVRPAFVYAGIAATLDVMLAAVYYWLTEYSTAYMVITALLQIGYLALITTVMWVRLKGPVRQDRWQGRWLGLGRRLDTAEAQRRPSLFLFVVPLLTRPAPLTRYQSTRRVRNRTPPRSTLSGVSVAAASANRRAQR